jgi:hypothetical protein
MHDIPDSQPPVSELPADSVGWFTTVLLIAPFPIGMAISFWILGILDWFVSPIAHETPTWRVLGISLALGMAFALLLAAPILLVLARRFPRGN